MKLDRLLIVFSLCMVSQTNVCLAQKKWSLTECIDYAITCNLQIKRYENNCKESEIQLNSARNSRLPNVSAGTGANFDFGRTISENNTYINRNIKSASFSVSTSVPIFTGFQIPNNIRLKELNKQAAKYDLQAVKENIRSEVTAAFFQVLYAKELLSFAETQTSYAQDLLSNINRYFEIGLIAESEVYQARSRVVNCELQEVQSQNNLMLASLSLGQIMELEKFEELEISELTEDMFSDSILLPAVISAETVDDSPIIKGAKIRLNAAERSLKIVKSGYWPQLSLSAGLSSRYYNYSNIGNQLSFREQMERYTNKYISLNLSVPIFNRFSTRNNIRSSKIAISNQAIALEEAQKSIDKEIQQAYYSALASKKQLEASNAAKRSAEELLRLAEVKYRNGSSTASEFNDVHTSYQKTCTEYLQNKYDFAYRCIMLSYCFSRLN